MSDRFSTPAQAVAIRLFFPGSEYFPQPDPFRRSSISGARGSALGRADRLISWLRMTASCQLPDLARRVKQELL
jgi:hypothetical protein